MPHPARENRLLNTIEMRERRIVMRSRPYSIQLEVTTKCNLACIMCARDKYHGRGENLEDSVLEPVLRDLLPTAQDIIVSSFGEPLLYPGIERLFAEIDPASGLELGFFTNFLLMTEEMAEHIIRSGVAYINASIDGATRETYERIRAGGKWDTLIEKLEMFARVKKRLGAKTPILNLCVVGSTLNIDEAALFVDFAKQHGFDSVKYNPNLYVDDEEMDYMSLVHEQEKTVAKFREAFRRSVELDLHSNFHRKPFKVSVPRGGASPSPHDVSLARVALNWSKRAWRNGIGWRFENTWKQSGSTGKAFLFLSAIKARDKVLDSVPVLGNVRRKVPIPHVIPNDAPPRSCGNPWTHVHVKSDGLVYPCCFSDEVMGDLRKQSFDEIWNSEKYQDLRRSMKTGNYWASCRRASCNWVEGCHSSIYGAEIKANVGTELEIDGTHGATVALTIRNKSKFAWNPSTPPPDGLMADVLSTADQKMIRRNTRNACVMASYRLLSTANELIDEGEHVSVPADVAIGQTIELELPIRPVRYAGKLKLKIDLVHEGVTWFGERSNSALEIPLRVASVPFAPYIGAWNKARLNAALNRVLRPGDVVELPIRVTNMGTETLGGTEHGDFLSYHWRRENGEYAEWEGLRHALRDSVPVGGFCDETMRVMVPRDLETGRYRLEFDAVRENETWISTCWNRPMLAYPIRVAAHEGDEASLSDRTEDGKLLGWEPIGQCAPQTGNKGIW